MHSIWVRANALSTNVLLVAALMAIVTSLTGVCGSIDALPLLFGILLHPDNRLTSMFGCCADYINMPPIPAVDVKMKSLDVFKRVSAGEEVGKCSLPLL